MAAAFAVFPVARLPACGTTAVGRQPSVPAPGRLHAQRGASTGMCSRASGNVVIHRSAEDTREAKVMGGTHTVRVFPP